MQRGATFISLSPSKATYLADETMQTLVVTYVSGRIALN